MTKPLYNQGDILQRVALDPWQPEQLAVVVRVSDFHGFNHYELRWTNIPGPSFFNDASYIDTSPNWRLYAEANERKDV